PTIARQSRRFGWLAIPALALVAAAWLQMPRIVRAELLLRSSVAATLIRTTSTLPPRTYLHEALSRLDLGDEPDEVELPRGLITVGDDWNVILITVDTLRADTLPPVRDGDEDFAQEGDTPFLDGWIAGSYRFRRAYANATMTHRSMPALFRSLETFEDPLRFGIPISTYMASHGRMPVAIANNYFIEPRFAAARALLDGFERISIYEKQEMRDQVALTRELIESVDGRPFFAWVHFYCMHDPGYDGEMLSGKDGTWRERYRASLRWLDSQMGALIGVINELGLGEKTLIVFTSDHGEGLGDHGTANHGPTIFDPEIRIPLVIHVPGREGAEIDATVGNIDVLPTIVDLLGLPLDPTHRGQSLVPLLAEPDDAAWDRDYYIENDKG
ncbi:MAG: sulfatase, partial [Myxococcales bacterium]|nr:sulfatase [Myxococcales bacterium]